MDAELEGVPATDELRERLIAHGHREPTIELNPKD